MNGSQGLSFAGCAILAVTFIASQAEILLSPAASVAILSGVGASLLAISLWHGRPQNERRYVSLGAVFCAYYAISYGFAVAGEAPKFSDRVLPFGLDPIDMSSVPLGILAWFAGYRILHIPLISRSGRKLLLPDTTRGPVGPGTLLAIYSTTAIARVALIISGAGYGYLQNAEKSARVASPALQYAAEYGGFGIVVLGLAVVASGHSQGRRAGYRRSYLVMFPVEIILGTLVGQKSEFLIVVVMFMLALYAAGRISMSPRKLVVVGLVSLLTIFPLVGTYRDILRPEVGKQLGANEAPGALVMAVEQTSSAFLSGPGEYVQFAFDGTAGRLREIDRAAVAIQAHDAGLPYSDPADLLLRVALGLVPRALWPEKPLNLYSLEVTRDYYGVSESVISSSSLSPIGDAYRYGGIAMVGLIMLLLGGYVRNLDEMLAARHSIWLVPLLIAAIPLLRSGDLAGLLVGTLRYYLIVGLLYRLLFIRAYRSWGFALPRTGSGSTGLTESRSRDA